jgi:acyl-CoA synthetase (NDP forming)
LPALTEASTTRLRKAVPHFILATNPLDLTAQALVDPAIYQRALAAVLDDPAYGVFMFGIILTDEMTSGRKLPAIIQAIKTLKPSKPVIVAGLDEGAAVSPILIASLRALGVPFFVSSERVFTAISRLQRRRIPLEPARDAGPGGTRFAPGVIPEYRAKLLLSEIGLTIPSGQLVQSVEDAVSIADGIGYPVVLKAQSVDISHKSDVGGVVLNLATPQALRVGWTTLQENLQRHCPDAPLEGVLVETMGRRGTELIIGARRDPDWGLVLLAGFGGIMAEALQDVRLLSTGLDKPEIIAELRQLKSSAILDGFRGSPALDIDAAAGIIVKLDQFLQAHPEIIELDINPMVLLAAGEGAVALDALMQVQ